MDRINGLLSCRLATIIFHPIDVVKTNYQVSRLTNNTNNTIIDTIISIYRSNGINSFYKGS
jgi:hypothetical protein